MSSLLPYLAFALVLYGFVLAYRWRGGGKSYYANRDSSAPVGHFTPGSTHASSGWGGGGSDFGAGGGCGDGGGGGSCG